MEWRLDSRGLEWTKADGNDHWMPFACIRLATLGYSETRGWRLRLSGPPGAVFIYSGAEGACEQDVNSFKQLAEALILGAQAAGCRAKFRVNHQRFPLDWIWARGGVQVGTGAELVSVMSNPLNLKVN